MGVAAAEMVVVLQFGGASRKEGEKVSWVASPLAGVVDIEKVVVFQSVADQHLIGIHDLCLERTIEADLVATDVVVLHI